ncbi:MAG: phosphocarrier protein HPr [Paracoccaceae bacterium]|jgi:phosphocarrier protein HPr
MAQQTLKIVNERGLHARAAAKFTTIAEEFEAEITVSNGRESVGGRSIMGLLLLGAAQGTEITVTSEGADADAAMEAIAALVTDGFGEDRDETA